jgi:hypothetical protein
MANQDDYRGFGWWDCTCEVICACGNAIILNDDDDPKLCSCGRIWKLETKLICKHVKEEQNDN